MNLEKIQEILTRFRSEHMEEYSANRKEVRTDSGYGDWPNSQKIILHVRSMCKYVEEEFQFVRIPEDFASPKTLLKFLKDLIEYLNDNHKIIETSINSYTKPELVPDPLHIAMRMNNEITDVVKYSLLYAKNECKLVTLFKNRTNAQVALLLPLTTILITAFSPAGLKIYSIITNENNHFSILEEKIYNNPAYYPDKILKIYPLINIGFFVEKDWKIFDKSALEGVGELEIEISNGSKHLRINLELRSEKSEENDPTKDLKTFSTVKEFSLTKTSKRSLTAMRKYKNNSILKVSLLSLNKKDITERDYLLFQNFLKSIEFSF